jgi:hypothetical protein
MGVKDEAGMWAYKLIAKIFGHTKIAWSCGLGAKYRDKGMKGIE